MPFQSKNLSDNDRHYIDNFEETLSNTAVGDLDSISQTEEATLREVKGDLGGINEEKFTSLDGNIRFPIDKAISREGRGIARCVGVVHTSPERVLAWQFHVDSDERRAKHTKTNGFDTGKYPNKTIRDVNFRHQINYSCRKLPFPLQPRDWLVRAVFAPLKNNLGYILATKSISDDDPDIPNDFKRSTLEKAPIRGSLNSLCIFEKLPFGCTKFTYLARVHIGGAVPLVVAEGKLSGHVNNVRIAYDFFERDDEVDKLQRDDFVDNMNNACFLTSDERSLLLRCIPYADHSIAAGGGIGRQNAIVMSASQRAKWTRLSDANFAVKKFTKKKEGDSALWGKAKAQIHTSAAEAHAWVWFYCSNFRTKQHMKKQGDDMIRQNIGITDGHTQHIVVQKGMTMGLHTRETKTRLVWGEFNSKLVIAFEPSEIPFSDGRIRRTRAKTNFRIRRDKSSPSSVSPISTRNSNDVEADSNVVQLHYKGVWIFDKKSDNICDVTFVNRIEDKGKLPTKIVNASIGRTLDVVSQLKRFFERNGGAVDQELRYAFMVKIPEVTTNDDQRDIIEEQMGKVDLNDDKWEPLEKESSAFVKLSKIHVKGESVAWGRAVAIIDASAEKVVAWLWDYCSNERMAAVKNLEENPRELIKAISDNHAVYNTIKSLPWPLNTRQFVFESTWTKREDGGFVYAWRPPQADTHYDSSQLSMGKSKRGVVRGTTRGFIVIVPEDASCCTIVNVQQSDVGGRLPPKIMDLQVSRALKSVFQLREKFNRDDEIDKIEREMLMEIMRNSDQEVYSSSEEQLIDSVRKKMEIVSEDLFRPLQSPDFRTKMSIAHVEGENNAYLKCEVILDTSVEECAAYNYTIMSRKRMKIHDDSPDTIRREVKHFNHHALENYLVKDLGFGLRPRKFMTKHVWQKTIDDKIVHVNQDVPHSELFEEANRPSLYVVAKTTALLSYEQNSADNTITKLTFIVQFALSGFIPHTLVDRAAIGFLNDICVVRKVFCRDREIDLEARRSIISKINDASSVLTEDEQNKIQRARDQFKMFKNSEGIKVTINTGDEFVSAVGGRVGGKIWCKLSTTVRCSGVEALAFVTDVTSRSLLSEHDVVDGKRVLKDEGHTRVVKVVEEDSSGGGLHHVREIVRSVTWERRQIEARGGSMGGSEAYEILVYMTPTEFNTPASNNVEGKHGRRSLRQSFLARKPTTLSLKITDKTTCLAKIVPVGEEKCNIEMLVDTPKKYKKRKKILSRATVTFSIMFQAILGIIVSLIADDVASWTLIWVSINSILFIAWILLSVFLDFDYFIGFGLGGNFQSSFLGLGVNFKSSNSTIDLREQKETTRLLTNMYDFRVLSTMQRCFLRWRPLSKLEEEDGTAMGKMLMENTTRLFNTRERSKKARKAMLELFFGEVEGMKTLQEEQEWFETMIESVILGTKETDTSNTRFNGKIDLLTAFDGHTLGSSFLYYMGRSATEVGAVKSWLNKHPALEQFHHQHKFFVPLMKEIGKTMRHTETWYKVVLSGCVGLFSLFDVGSDIYSILYYRSIEEYEVAKTMMVFLVLSLGLQMGFVVVVHHKNKRRMKTELFGTLTYSKPAFNKWRVLTNVRVEDHVILPPVNEMMAFKLCEVFAESIPMTVLQVDTLLTMEELDPIVVGSLLVSAIFVAEAVTYMTYVKDIDEESRKTGRLFYGFIPLSGVRMVLVKGSMYVLSFCQLMGKSITVALLIQIGGKTLAFVATGCEIAVYLLYKVLRRDFRYWVPLQRASMAFTLIIRIIVKVVTDFTGMLHTRQPLEMGGFYWLMNQLYTQISLFVMLSARINVNDSETVFKEDLIWKIAVGLSSTWCIAILALLYFCNSEYRHTFYSAWTSKTFQKKRFEEGDDRTKFRIMTTVHRNIWKSFKEDMEGWLAQAWDSLHQEKPDWFTENAIARIPFDMIPHFGHKSVREEAGEEENTILASKRRRSSVSLREIVGLRKEV